MRPFVLNPPRDVEPLSKATLKALAISTPIVVAIALWGRRRYAADLAAASRTQFAGASPTQDPLDGRRTWRRY